MGNGKKIPHRSLHYKIYDKLQTKKISSPQLSPFFFLQLNKSLKHNLHLLLNQGCFNKVLFQSYFISKFGNYLSDIWGKTKTKMILLVSFKHSYISHSQYTNNRNYFNMCCMYLKRLSSFIFHQVVVWTSRKNPPCC